MEDFLHRNSLYIVLGIALIIWIGIVIYLFMIDKKLIKIEKSLSSKNLESDKN